MTDPERRAHNEAMLAQCYPAFRARLEGLLAALEHEGHRPRIACAWRSPADQAAAFASGHSKLRFGFHNVTGPAGEPAALAADVLDDDAPMTPGRPYLFALAGLAWAVGLGTGILWGLSEPMAVATRQAIQARATGASEAVKIGWDPCHVQTTEVSANAARLGARPA